MKLPSEQSYTVASMFGEYKICKNFLTLEDFLSVYPDVTQADLQELERCYQAHAKQFEKVDDATNTRN